MLFLALAASALAPDAFLWNVADIARTGQLTIFNTRIAGGDYGLPVELGDYDGDGHIDFVLAPMAADSGPDGDRFRAGEVYVYPGDGTITGVLDRGVIPAERRGLTILGARGFDFTGTELFTSDVNGDGVEDLLISAQNHAFITGPTPAEQRLNCGAVWVVFGRDGLLDDAPVIDLLDPPAGILRIVGATAGERLGIWVEAGDLDADGFDDILIGADQWPARSTAEEPRRHVGRTYVVYGREEYPDTIDLATFRDGVSEIRGRDDDDHFGACVHSRDLDLDGHAELIIGAGLDRLSASEGGDSPFVVHATGGGAGPTNTRFRAGEVWVLSPDADLPRFPALVDLRSGGGPQIASRATLFHGVSANAKTGEEITSGDFDGDGFGDIVLGSITADSPNGEQFVGAAHLIYWQPGLEGREFDLAVPAAAQPPGAPRISAMFGLRRVDILGDTLSAGDFNHDGFDDLAIGIPHYDEGTSSSDDRGLVAVVFGRATTLPGTWFPQNDVLPQGVEVAFVVGAQAHDLLSYSMEARDVDGDGYADLFPNAMRGDGAGDRFAEAGEAVLISGRLLSRAELRVDRVTPPAVPSGLAVTISVEGDGFTTNADTRVTVDGVDALAVRVATGRRLEADLPPSVEAGLRSLTVTTRFGESRCNECLFVDPGDGFVRGDANRSGRVDISDAVSILLALFLGDVPACDDAHDTNDDGRLDVSDAVYLLDFLFRGGPTLPAPFPEPGDDPSDDALGCDA